MSRAHAAFLMCFLAAPSAAEEGAAFLKILPGARPIAMGEAYTAVADDLSALSTNPSGLSRIGSREVSFMDAELYVGTRYDFLGYAQPLSEGAPLLGGGTLGFGVQRLSNDPIPGRDASGNPTGAFASADTAIDLGYSRPLSNLSTLVGFNAKFIDSQIADVAARTVAFDLGVMQGAHLMGQKVTFGAAVENFGAGLRYGDQTTSLPLALALGASVRLRGALLLAVDVKDRPNSSQTSFDVGTEYSILPAFSVRAGYATVSAQGSSSTSGVGAGLGGLGMGFGLKLFKSRLDFSFSPAGDLGSATRLSLSSRF